MRIWAASPAANRGLKIVQAGRAELQEAILELSYVGPAAQPLPVVTQLQGEHRNGQTFLTWCEPHNIVGKDEPTFEKFELAILDAQAERRIFYRVYRHSEPITAINLGQAELVCEVPEALSGWNLLAIANTEHPQLRLTKRSPLRSGNLRLEHIMTRYRVSDNEAPLPRTVGLAVLTAKQPGSHYYAVTVSADGREAVDRLTAGQSLTVAIDESPAKFPAIINGSII